MLTQYLRIDHIPLHFSGWLSGKVKRDGNLEEGSRIAWSSAQDGRRNQSHPDYKQFAESAKVWNLLDFMEKIGKKHGTYF